MIGCWVQVLHRLGQMARRLLALCLLLCVLPMQAQGTELRLLATTFPVWLFTRNIIEGVEGISVELMLPAGAGCPHDYALTPQDMRKLARADILIMNGLGLDDFARRPFEEAAASQGLGPRLIVASGGLPGTIRTDFEDHDHDEHHDHDHDHAGPNGHVFASPSLAALLVLHMGDSLAELDPAQGDVYRANAQAYAQQLQTVAQQFQQQASGWAQVPVFIQHSALAYLAEAAGFTVAGIIQAHEGQEPAAARLLRLSAQIREQGIAAIFIEPQYPERAGATLAQENNIPLILLDTLASGPADAPLSYYQDQMRHNLALLLKAFGSND